MASIYGLVGLRVTPIRSPRSKLGDPKTVKALHVSKLSVETLLVDSIYNVHGAISRVYSGIYVLLPRVHSSLIFLCNLVPARYVFSGYVLCVLIIKKIY